MRFVTPSSRLRIDSSIIDNKYFECCSQILGKKTLIFLSFFKNSDFQSIVECELRKIIIKSSLDNGEKKWPHIHRPSSIPISDLSRDTAKWFSVDKLDGPGRAKPGWLKVPPPLL